MPMGSIEVQQKLQNIKWKQKNNTEMGERGEYENAGFLKKT